MQSIRHWPLAIAIATLGTGPYAAENGYSTAYTACMDESGGVTANMLDCIGSEIKQQDARLNQNYNAAMQALEHPQQTHLRDAQRLWIKFRDTDCSLLGSLTGGTVDGLNQASCFLDMTQKRADDLAWLAEQGL